MIHPRLAGALAAALLLSACTDAGPTAPLPPSSFELTDATRRIDADDVNAWVFGSFTVAIAGSAGPRVLGMNGPEAANFPGIGVFYGGHCVEGLWYNPKGKPTSGSVARPHPHCVEYAAGEAMTIVLEPISAAFAEPGSSGGHVLKLGKDEGCGTGDDLKVQFVRAGPSASGYPNSDTRGCGIVEAYGLDVATIATTKTRVGTFAFDLNQYDTGNGIASLTDLFDLSCGGNVVLGGLTVSGCLGKEINATFTPTSGPTQNVTGYLYWEMSARTNAFYNDAQ
ncbi:MAG TPA: hypothetical protein VK922_01155 [Gemmatimonadaceae bacterium]|nr:hypothetical protein [Gemmatimonadaceae bacterium]